MSGAVFRWDEVTLKVTHSQHELCAKFGLFANTHNPLSVRTGDSAACSAGHRAGGDL